MVTDRLQVPVLVLGGGTGALAAALQCARAGTQVLLVTPGPWLGGMITAGGVSAPDGNELSAWQTGLWGALLRELRQQLADGLDHNWVSCFGFQPAQAEAVFQRWAKAESLLQWRPQCPLKELRRRGDRLQDAVFETPEGLLQVAFELLIDGTELGDGLAMAELPFRSGWEPREQWDEPSAPSAAQLAADPFFQQQPLQSPTWVITAQWQGPWEPPQSEQGSRPLEAPFAGCFERFSLERLLSYGRLPGGMVMLNWPLNGNDWHQDPAACLSADANRRQAQLQAMAAHSRAFLAALQQRCDGRLQPAAAYPGGALALQPYWRESRRLIGHTTVIEQQLLPEHAAAAPADSIAVGNYANDHHYPGADWPLAPKSQPWGGRWSGTPFTIPFRALHGPAAANLLMADKGFSVSHMANGATRLGPLLLLIGQAAGQAAALCQQRRCLPAELPVKELQQALISDPQAPSAVRPAVNLAWHDPQWRQQQQALLAGADPTSIVPSEAPAEPAEQSCVMHLDCIEPQRWIGITSSGERWPLISLEPAVQQQLPLLAGQSVQVLGRANPWGPWWRINRVLR